MAVHGATASSAALSPSWPWKPEDSGCGGYLRTIDTPSCFLLWPLFHVLGEVVAGFYHPGSELCLWGYPDDQLRCFLDTLVVQFSALPYVIQEATLDAQARMGSGKTSGRLLFPYCCSSSGKHGRASAKRRNPVSPTSSTGEGNTKDPTQINMNFNNGRRHSKERKICTCEGRRCWETGRPGDLKRTQ